MDTYADKNYRLLFDTEGEWYCNDARTIEPERMPDFKITLQDLLARHSLSPESEKDLQMQEELSFLKLPDS